MERSLGTRRGQKSELLGLKGDSFSYLSMRLPPKESLLAGLELTNAEDVSYEKITCFENELRLWLELGY